jgi:two-component system, chemotaxis family, chemotaxis protein CheY
MKNILVIDDCTDVRKNVEYTLKCLGLTIRQAANGSEGLELVERLILSGESIELCIVDMQMPVMDGVTFARKFRENDKLTPVIILTSEANEKNLQEGRLCGASGLMMKPFRPDDMVEAAKRFITL